MTRLKLRRKHVARSLLHCLSTYAAARPKPGAWPKTMEQCHAQGYAEAIDDALAALKFAGFIDSGRGGCLEVAVDGDVVGIDTVLEPLTGFKALTRGGRK